MEIIEINSNSKALRPATYKQYLFLKELMIDPEDELPAVSRFTKKLDRGIASEAIQHKLNGNIVKIKI